MSRRSGSATISPSDHSLLGSQRHSSTCDRWPARRGPRPHGRARPAAGCRSAVRRPEPRPGPPAGRGASGARAPAPAVPLRLSGQIRSSHGEGGLLGSRHVSQVVCPPCPDSSHARRGRDSNPRTRSTPVTRFPVAPVQPLRHLSRAGPSVSWCLRMRRPCVRPPDPQWPPRSHRLRSRTRGRRTVCASLDRRARRRRPGDQNAAFTGPGPPDSDDQVRDASAPVHARPQPHAG